MGQWIIEYCYLHSFYAAPIGAFFCPEIRAFTGFGADFFNRFQSA